MKKKYLIGIVIIILVIIPIVALAINKHIKKTNPHSSQFNPVPIPSNGTYVTEDSSIAPDVQYGAIEGKITRETRVYKNQIWQKFVIDNDKTDSQRVIFEQEDTNTFEKMGSQNWSPTNRFFYVIYDMPDGRKNFLIFETDGRFVNTQYYIQPFQPTTSQTVSKISWSDGETLDFTVKNLNDNAILNYDVDLNDSAGVLQQIH